MLDEVLEKINELYAGDFRDADKVLTDILRKRMEEDPKLQKDVNRMESRFSVRIFFLKHLIV